MPSYLFVAFYGSRTFFKVESPKYGVLAELALDVQQCLLHPAFFCLCLLLSNLLCLQCFIVSEQVQLHGSRACLPDISFVDDMVGGQGEATYQQVWVDNPVV